jgi:hypothetical protein
MPVNCGARSEVFNAPCERVIFILFNAQRMSHQIAFFFVSVLVL